MTGQSMTTDIEPTSPTHATQDTKIEFAIGKSIESNEIQNKKLAWATFQEVFEKAPSNTKHHMYLLPARYSEPVRRAQNIQYVTMLCLDLDHISVSLPEAIDTLERDLEDYTYIFHTTHSSTYDEPRIRLIVPLASPMHQPAYYAPAAYQLLAETAWQDWVDTRSLRANQPMFLPSAADPTHYTVKMNDGKLYAPDYAAMPQPEDATQTIEDPHDKAGLVGAFCITYSIDEAIKTFLYDRYEPSQTLPDRYTYRYGSTVNGASVLENKWLYSHHESDPAGGRLLNAYDLVRIHLYAVSYDSETGEPRLDESKLDGSYDKMRTFAKKDADVHQHLITKRAEELKNMFKQYDSGDDPDDASTSQMQDIEMTELDDNDSLSDVIGEEISEEGQSFVEQQKQKLAWLEELQMTAKGDFKSTYMNLVIILSNDPVFDGLIGYNEFSNCVMQLASFSDCKISNRPIEWSNSAELAVRTSIDYRYGLDTPPAKLMSAINAVARYNRYHPVRDWIKKLKWDGTSRIETLFIDYLHTADNTYYRETARAFMVAAVKRIFEPGCKFDHVPILEGTQGIGKSSFWRILAKDLWFSELSTFDTKAAAEIMQGCWILEIPELDAFSKFEVEQIKQFFSAQTDRFREAYAVRAQTTHRQCVFAGTTNQSIYLKDRTGNRRFWPIKSNITDGMIALDDLKREVDQLWAEAYQLYLDGAQPKLSDEATAQANEEQKQREEIDDWEMIIQDFLSKPTRSDRYDYDKHPDKLFDEIGGEDEAHPKYITRAQACIPEIWEDLFNLPVSRLTKSATNRVRRAVQALPNWEVAHVWCGERYGRQRGFVRIDVKPENITSGTQDT